MAGNKSISVARSVHDLLRGESERTGEPVAWIVRRLIDDFLDDAEDDALRKQRKSYSYQGEF